MGQRNPFNFFSSNSSQEAFEILGSNLVDSLSPLLSNHPGHFGSPIAVCPALRNCASHCVSTILEPGTSSNRSLPVASYPLTRMQEHSRILLLSTVRRTFKEHSSSRSDSLLDCRHSFQPHPVLPDQALAEPDSHYRRPKYFFARQRTEPECLQLRGRDGAQLSWLPDQS